MLLIVNFPHNSPVFLLFLHIKFGIYLFGINPIACLFLVHNLCFIRFFIHRGHSPDRIQPIKEHSLKYCPFLLFNISLPLRDCNISLARVYWRYSRISVCLRGIIFLFLRQLTVDK